MRIGLISDTHLPGEVRHLGQLGPRVEEFLTSVDLILHGGDILATSVLDWLEQFAPVLAARGNNDGFPTDTRVEPVHFLDVEGWRIGMCHDMEQRGPVDWMYERYLRNERVDIMVSGHTHFEHLEYREGAVIMNSGSPSMPHNYSTRLGTAGLLELTWGELKASIIRLGESEGRRNPGIEGSLHIRDGEIIEDNRILAVA